MARRSLEIQVTPAVRAAQEHYFGRALRVEARGERDALTPEEMRFIQFPDTFCMATSTDSDWPYVQHRGGAPGFVRAIAPNQLAFAYTKGNRQMLSTGHLATNDLVALILMDDPRRERLKILGHARVEDARLHPALVAALVEPERRAIVEQVFLIDVVSFDWNFPKYITPRFTAADVEDVVATLRQRIAELEARLGAGAQR